MLKIYLRYFLGSIPVSIFVFLAILYPLVSLKNGVDSTKLSKSVAVTIAIPSDKELREQSEQKFLSECGNINVDCQLLMDKDFKETKARLLEKKHSVTLKESGSFAFIKYVFDTNYMINFIYALLILALNFPISTSFYIKFEKIDDLDGMFFDIIDWAINTPPILGVLGTIIAFAILVAQGGEIQSAFSRAFFDAALTTIAGGLIYTLNLGLKVYIFKHISSK